jgi:hypothetical protein
MLQPYCSLYCLYSLDTYPLSSIMTVSLIYFLVLPPYSPQTGSLSQMRGLPLLLGSSDWKSICRSPRFCYNRRNVKLRSSVECVVALSHLTQVLPAVFHHGELPNGHKHTAVSSALIDNLSVLCGSTHNSTCLLYLHLVLAVSVIITIILSSLHMQPCYPVILMMLNAHQDWEMRRISQLKSSRKNNTVTSVHLCLVAPHQ